MSQNYLEMFNRFFNKEARMASTYKPVFLRALLDVGDLNDSKKAQKLIGDQWLERKNGKLLVDLNFIAVRFAKYYWDMEYSFRLRQSQDPQDANITRFIKNIHEPGKKPPTLKELTHNEMINFRNKVIDKSIKREVLVHLLTDMSGFYKKIDSKTIEFDEDVVEFLHKHKILLRKGINSVLAKYLEKLNRMTPAITNKVDYEMVRRKQLQSEIQLRLEKIQESMCFYHNGELKHPHVDHVIPYNYVFSTEPYNCVLACQQCNCMKSDMLPTSKIFRNVLERNNEISEYMKTMNIVYDEESYIRLFDTCKAEYNTGDFFKPSI